MQKILILAANPKNTSRLRLDEELREIEQGLQRAEQREKFEIKSALAVRSRDIHRSILDFQPNIVHFSGHGSGQDGLIFEDETGLAKLVDALALARLFKLFANSVKCVVLNACYSEIQAKAIAQHIDYVIGMSQAVGDRAAIEFAVGFYDALGAGRSIEFAYELGCTLIQMQGISEELTPKLLEKKHEVIQLECLGEINGPRWLDARIADGTVGLVSNPDLTGTRWQVRAVSAEVIQLECLGEINGPRWLDGRTADGTVGLVSNPDLTGTRWKLHRVLL